MQNFFKFCGLWIYTLLFPEMCLYFFCSVRWLAVVEDLMENLSLILSHVRQISLTRSIMRWTQFIDQLWITNQNIDVPSGSAVISVAVCVYLYLCLHLIDGVVCNHLVVLLLLVV